MRVWSVLFLFLSASLFAAAPALPPELKAALENFRGDPPRNWSFTQTTEGEGKSTVERSDATKPDFERWSLVAKDGRTPTEQEQRTYHDGRSRRTGNAPRITEQLDLETLEVVADVADRATYRFRLRPGEAGDKIAAFLRATLVFHKPTQTIESFELASTGEFSPNFGVKIAEMRTRMTYSLPTGDTPTLPQKVETHLRGRAFWFKSLDAEMTVTFSDYAPAKK